MRLEIKIRPNKDFVISLASLAAIAISIGALFYLDRQIRFGNVPIPSPEPKEEDKVFNTLKTVTTTELLTIPEAYRDVPDHTIVISSDLESIAYPVFTRDKRQFVVRDNKIERTYDEVSGLLFSPDSGRFVYRARQADDWFMVLDGKEEKYYDGIGDPVFSPDGSQFAYVAYSSESGLQFVVLNGRELKGYDGTWAITFSTDSKHLAQIAKSRDEVFAVLDPFDKLRVNAEQSRSVDGKETPRYKATWAGEFVFSRDSTQHAFVVTNTDGSGFVAVNGQAGKVYDGVGQPVFSPDASELAHVASKDGKGFVVRNGLEENNKYDVVDVRIQIWAPTFSPSSRIFAYGAARRGRWRMVVNGSEGNPYDAMANPVFSPSSQHLAYVAQIRSRQQTNQLVVLDGEELEPYENVRQLTFSSDSRHLTYIARRNGKQFAVVTSADPSRKESKIGQSYDYIWHIRLSADGKILSYVARLGRTLFLVTEEISP